MFICPYAVLLHLHEPQAHPGHRATSSKPYKIWNFLLLFLVNDLCTLLRWHPHVSLKFYNTIMHFLTFSMKYWILHDSLGWSDSNASIRGFSRWFTTNFLNLRNTNMQYMPDSNWLKTFQCGKKPHFQIFLNIILRGKKMHHLPMPTDSYIGLTEKLLYFRLWTTPGYCSVRMFFLTSVRACPNLTAHI